MLLNFTDLTIAFGDKKLLDDTSLTVEANERVGLLGRNGEGKSTLLKILSGKLKADDGTLQIKSGVRISVLEQTPSAQDEQSVYDCVAAGLGDIGTWIAQYHSTAIDTDLDEKTRLDQLGHLQHQLDSHDGWKLQQKVEKIISQLHLPADSLVKELSGGWQRRVSLAQALVSDPQILLLDEPTNHLDIKSIEWLEKQIIKFKGAVIFVTHDRAFLQRVATRIIDLDRGQLQSWAGTYDDFLRRKAAKLAEEEEQNRNFDKKLASEEAWIRQGIKARRTRNEGRVRDLKKLREIRAERRDKIGQAKLNINQANISGKVLIEAKNMSFAYEESLIIDQLSTTIVRGDRIGLLGPNGVGKTTLIRLLLGEIKASSGEVKLGTNLEVAYFDQLRSELDPNQTIIDAVGLGRDQITINNKSRHIISYLSDFLFTPARSRSPIRSLSGGERARVLLARLFSKPLNLLVMDEPTNDLDIETLELLEEILSQFNGTLILVSHDREFLDNVVTSALAFEGDGIVREYVGGYSDWIRQCVTSETASKNSAQSEPKAISSPSSPGKEKAPPSTKKLGFNEKRELEQLPEKIDILESEQQTLTNTISDTGFYQQSQETISTTLERMKEVSEQLESLYTRWSELES